LALIQTPALVMHARGFIMSPVEQSMRLAAQIPGARMVVTGGSGTYGDANESLEAIESFLGELTPPAKPQAEASTLSSRELEVLRLMAAGRSNAQIAETLVISPHTVARHVSNILDKIGAANRAEASVYAVKNGIE
jgi:DNA-binding NarL/FixJ family response regulator